MPTITRLVRKTAMFSGQVVAVTVSDYLEKNAIEEPREMGADLADWVVRERISSCQTTHDMVMKGNGSTSSL